MTSPILDQWTREDQTAAKCLFHTSGTVKPEWIDYNNHMNVAYYVLAFDTSDTACMYKHLGLTDDFRKQTNMSTMTAEAHIHYLSEISEGETYHVYSQIIDFDSKRWHEIKYMLRDGGVENHHPAVIDNTDFIKENLVATYETIALSVDLSVRRVKPWHTETLDRLYALWQEHYKFAKPDWLSGSMGIPTEKSLALRH